MQKIAEQEEAFDLGREAVWRGFDCLGDENNRVAFFAGRIAVGVAAPTRRYRQQGAFAAVRADLDATERKAQAKRRGKAS